MAAATVAVVALAPVGRPVPPATASAYLSAQGTALVDGLRGVGEWDAAARIDFAVAQPPGSPGPPMPATLLVMNDATNLYVAFQIVRSTLGSSNVDVAFDNDADGTPYANGDDVVLLNPSLGGLFDEYSTNLPPCPPGGTCAGILDTDAGGTNDGIGATTNNGSYSFYELSHPLNSTDDSHDFSLVTGDLVGATAEVRFCDLVGCQDTVVTGPRLLAIAPLPNGKANQRITFAPLPPRTYGDAGFPLHATASSRLPVSFTASGSCTVDVAVVVLTGAGSCRIVASQAGDAEFNPGPDVAQTFAVAKASQSIDFAPIRSKTFGAPDFRVSASASSGLGVSFSAAGRCIVRGATVHLTGVGSCTVTAAQAGDADYLPAEKVSRTFFIRRPPPCRVPNVVGKHLAAAKRTIRGHHCRTGVIRRARSELKRGLVVSQNRRAGRVLPFRSKINLVVSRGSKQ